MRGWILCNILAWHAYDVLAVREDYDTRLVEIVRCPRQGCSLDGATVHRWLSPPATK